jgi:hypothetical protein
MSTFFCGITETLSSLFRGIIFKLNSVPNPILVCCRRHRLNCSFSLPGVFAALKVALPSALTVTAATASHCNRSRSHTSNKAQPSTLTAAAAITSTVASRMQPPPQDCIRSPQIFTDLAGCAFEKENI